MSVASVDRTGSLLGHTPFLQYLLARGFSGFAFQISAVAFGWQIYDLTGSAFYLGLVGLAQFVPVLALIFVGGHIADRYERKRIVQICQLVEASCAAFLAWGSISGRLNVGEIFAVLIVLGIAKSFESPAGASMLPALVPASMFQRATALCTGMQQIARITGPAIGGLALIQSPAAPYIVMTVCSLLASVFNGAIKMDRPAVAKQPPTLSDAFAGIKFVRSNPSILGSISLDLFAVLLGGATALLPIYAKDILHSEPWALGVMRAAPAVGALLVSAFITRYPIRRRVGMRMFQAVIMFGAATVVFAFSPWLWLSIPALMVMGGADMVSVVIRVSLVQLATPDAMRGRVSAVNFLFINTSNLLGEFESGMTAWLFGAMPAAAIGGFGTIAIALLWMRLFPTLRDVERLG